MGFMGQGPSQVGSQTCQCHPCGSGLKVTKGPRVKLWDPFLWFQRTTGARPAAGVPAWGLRGHSRTSWKWSLSWTGNLKILKKPKPWNICQKELHAESGTNPRERQGAKLKLWSHLNPLTTDIELQDLEVFFLLEFSLALVQYFLTLPKFLPFGMVM